MGMIAKIRWGVLGAGGIARDFATALAESHHGTLVAAASRSRESAETFAREYPGCRAHASIEDLLADASVDAVYVATPHPSHAEWTIRAVRAGKHVLCEKPFAMNEAEAARVFEAVRGTGRCVIEAFKDRFHPLTEAVAGALPQIGKVCVIEAAFSYRAEFNSQSRLFAPELGGGGILDVGCYPVNFARRIAGAAMGRVFADPEEVVALAEFTPSGVDAYSIATLRFAGGILARASCGISVEQEGCARIHGSEGWIHVPHPWTRFPAGKAMATLQRADGKSELLEVTADRPVFALEADALAECVAQGLTECPAMNWADTLSNMRTLDRWRAAIGLRYPADAAT
jgi:predicted dehydrogenase